MSPPHSNHILSPENPSHIFPLKNDFWCYLNNYLLKACQDVFPSKKNLRRVSHFSLLPMQYYCQCSRLRYKRALQEIVSMSVNFHFYFLCCNSDPEILLSRIKCKISSRYFSKCFQKVFIIAQTIETSCANLEYCWSWAISKSFCVGNTNIFGDMSILTKKKSSVLCFFS